MNRYSILLGAFGLLAGCVTVPPPPLTADNPASASAPEATVHSLRNALAGDNLTKKTREIFAQAGKQRFHLVGARPVADAERQLNFTLGEAMISSVRKVSTRAPCTAICSSNSDKGMYDLSITIACLRASAVGKSASSRSRASWE